MGLAQPEVSPKTCAEECPPIPLRTSTGLPRRQGKVWLTSCGMQTALKLRLDGTARIAVRLKASSSPTQPSGCSRSQRRAKTALKQLDVYDYRKAPDGPGDTTLLEFLASAETGGEDEIINATAQIGRLAEIFDAIDAARLLEGCGRKAAEDAKHLSRLTSLKGRRGEYATNVWLADMMSIYKALTRKEPRITVISSGPNRGAPSGPFLRFLEAASGPVECEGKKPLCLDRVREQVRALSRAKQQRK
jgi:hypothetical protein